MTAVGPHNGRRCPNQNLPTWSLQTGRPHMAHEKTRHRSKIGFLFDHFIHQREQRGRHREAERARGRERPIRSRH